MSCCVTRRKGHRAYSPMKCSNTSSSRESQGWYIREVHELCIGGVMSPRRVGSIEGKDGRCSINDRKQRSSQKTYHSTGLIPRPCVKSRFLAARYPAACSFLKRQTAASSSQHHVPGPRRTATLIYGLISVHALHWVVLHGHHAMYSNHRELVV